MDQFSGAPPKMFHQPQTATFKMLRRLHGHNLENQGLNNLSEAFQSFVTRAKFFSIGRLRRTWSHSAVEFMKYRRLLPMIVGDEHDPGSVFDDFVDFGLGQDAAAVGLALPLTARPGSGTHSPQMDERKVAVTNVSGRATKSQLQSFFSKFGKIHSCHIPSDKHRREASMYATLPKQPRKWHGQCVIAFKSAQSAAKARRALPDELLFYGQQMSVGPFISTNSARRRTTSQTLSPRAQDESSSGGECSAQPPHTLSRASSASSLASSCSSATLNAGTPVPGMALGELPERALVLVLHYVGPLERIRLERVNKRWLEASARSWLCSPRLDFGADLSIGDFFSASRSLRHSHLKAILRRCGPHLRALSLAGISQLLDEKAIAELGTLCPNLEELDLSGVATSADALCALTESLPQLRSVAYREMVHTGERAFWFLFKAAAGQIRSADLRGCVRLRGKFFKLFGTQLEEAMLDGCTQICDELVEDLCARCTCLRTLKLDGCARLTDQSLSLVSRHLSELQLLTLCGEYPHFTGPSMAEHIPRIEQLQTLSLDYNPLVDDQLLGALAHSSALGDSLRHLSLAFAGTDKSITAKWLGELAQLRQLHTLDLSGLAAVNNATLKALCANGNRAKLQRIVLRSCSYLGDEGAAELCALPELEHIDLSGCILVSNESVSRICNAFKYSEEDQGLKLRQQPISLVIGGTICEPHRLRLARGTRVILDRSDNSSAALAMRFIRGSESPVPDGDGVENDDDEDDDFGILSGHRTCDALREEESPLGDDEKAILEWAQREAVELGLLPPEHQQQNSAGHK